MFKGETVATGATHPGTPLEVLQSAAGYYLGYRDEDGLPYSRESGYFANEEAASSALRQFPCELEQLGQGRYVADLAASNLMVSITIIPSRESFARLEITQYQLVRGEQKLFHNLVFEESVWGGYGNEPIEAAVARANEFLAERRCGSVAAV